MNKKLFGIFYLVFALIAFEQCAQYKQAFQADEIAHCKTECTIVAGLVYQAYYSSGEASCNAQAILMCQMQSLDV